MTSQPIFRPYKIRKIGDVILILHLQNLSQNKRFIDINPLFCLFVDSPKVKIFIFLIKKVVFFHFL